MGEGTALVILILAIVFGGMIFNSANSLGILIILGGGLLFFGVMSSAGADSDFNDAHSGW